MDQQGLIELITIVIGSIIARFVIPAAGKVLLDIVKTLIKILKDDPNNSSIVDGLVDRVTKLEEERKHDKKLIDDLIRSRTWFQNRLTAVETELAEAKKSLDTKDEQITTLTREREELIIIVNSLEKKIEELLNAKNSNGS